MIIKHGKETVNSKMKKPSIKTKSKFDSYFELKGDWT